MKPVLENVKNPIDKAKKLGNQGKTIIVEKTKNAWTNHRKKTIFGILVLIFLLILILGKGRSDLLATAHTVGTADITDQVVLSGRTESIQQVDLGFADAGRVQKVFVTEGQYVKQGQVLAELEMGDLYAQSSNARAALSIAKSAITQTGDNVDRITREQNAIVETAKRNLYGNLEAYPEDTFSSLQAPKIYGSYQGNDTGNYKLDIYGSNAATGASFNYSGLDYGTTSLTVDNRTSLGTKGLYIQFPNNVGYANTKWIIPVPNDRSSSYAGLKNAYETALASRDRAIQNAKADLNSGSNQSVLQSRVQQAQASLSQVYAAMARRRIVAPFSGTISNVTLKIGESTTGVSKDISPGVSMLATDQYKVVIKIPEIDVARVAPNTPVDITLDAYGPDTIFKGTLTTINPAETVVDGVPVYEGTVLFTEQNDKIRSGMTSTVTITIGSKQGVIAIPGNYIKEDKVARKSYVSMVDKINPKKKPTEREVKTGIRGSDGMTEIMLGLEKDELITTPEVK
jgi:HlyD family secretion protein